MSWDIWMEEFKLGEKQEIMFITLKWFQLSNLRKFYRINHFSLMLETNQNLKMMGILKET